MSMIRSLGFKLLLFLALFVALERFCHKKTRGFALSNIFPEAPLEESQEEMSKEVADLLAQRFYFLESGLECYAFVSGDKSVVLKVFKHHHVRQARVFSKLPFFPYGKKLAQEKRERMANSLASYKIAEKELKKETGLIAVHLKKTAPQKVTLVDRLGIAHAVDIGALPFLLQKKGEMVGPTLQNFLKSGDVEGAKECVRSLLSLVYLRCKKGIADRDPTLEKNFGFLGREAMVIDLGSFSYDPLLKHPARAKRELFDETLPLRCLLHKQFPELLPFFEAELYEIISK